MEYSLIVMRLRALSAFFVLAVLTTGVWGQRIPSQKPMLVVGITVSGMRYDYLSVYWDKFGDGGFRKMASINGNNWS